MFVRHTRLPVAVDSIRNGRPGATRGRDAGGSRRFERLVENARDLIYGTSRSSARLGIHQRGGMAITGARPKSSTRTGLALAAVHPEDRHTIARRSGSSREILRPVVLRWVHADGRIVCVEHLQQPGLRAARGALIAIEGMGRDVTEALAVADPAAGIREPARRLAASVNSAREAERADVARELHDELGQTLTGLKLELSRTGHELMERGLPQTDRSHPVDGRRYRSRGQRPCAAWRPRSGRPHSITWGLAPPSSSKRGRWHAAPASGAASLDSPYAGLGPAQTTALFRILQEALTNVARHAKASAIGISIRKIPRPSRSRFTTTAAA